jgi:drug/metabolite transporter (DMT)-like permease
MTKSATSRESSNLARGYVIALLSAAILSTTAIFIRYLSLEYRMPPLALAFWRDAFVTLTLAVGLRATRPGLLRMKGRHVPYLVLYGLALSIFNASWTLSVSLVGAAIGTVLVYCSAAFTAVLGWWFLKERLNWAKLLTVALCLAGCALVSGAWGAATWRLSLLGVMAGILSGLCYSFYSLMGRSASQRGLNPWTTVLYTFGFAAVFLLLFNLLTGKLMPASGVRGTDLLWLGDALIGWGLLFLLAAGPTVMGFGLYNVSLSYLPSSVANLIVTVEPVFTAAIAYSLLGERLTAMQMAGGLMILGGVAFLRIHEGRAARSLRLGGSGGLETALTEQVPPP